MEPEEIYQELLQNNYSKLLISLNTGFDINGFYFQENGTLLYRAIQDSRVEVVDFLLENGADPNILYYGTNSLNYLQYQTKKDVQILKKLLEANVLFLPVLPTGKSIVEFLENKEFEVEQELTRVEDEYEYLQHSNPNNANGEYYLSGMIIYHQESLDTIRELITHLRPLTEKNVKRLRIEISGRNIIHKISIDQRATVYILKTILSAFYFQDSVSFTLVYPRFHNKKKQVMEDERALSDYGLQDDSKLVVVIKISSERHWEGGKKTRKRHHKKKRQTKRKLL